MPQWAGQHRFEIKVNGQPLTSSSFFVHVEHQYQFAFKFGSLRNRAGNFDWISDIAVSDKTGTIAVSDYGNRRIQLFTSGGKFQRELGLDGTPFSVVFADCGDLLTLVFRSKNELCLFSEKGQFIKHYSERHLKKPQHLSIARDGRLIITDAGDNKIKVLSPDGNDLLLSFITPNCDKFPKCAVYHLEKFYVSYPEDDCIKVFAKSVHTCDRPPPSKPRTMAEKRSQCALLAFGTISLGTYGIHLLWRHLKED